MKCFSFHKLASWPAERLSSRVLFVLIGIVCVVFLLFWLVGFDLPFDDDPNFTAPLFTNLLLALIYILTLLAVGMGVWSLLRTLKVRGKSESIDNNIPIRKISYAVVFTTLGSMLLFFSAGSSQPMTINGVSYTDSFWLKMSDMFVCTSLFMIAAGVAVVIYCATKYNRKRNV